MTDQIARRPSRAAVEEKLKRFLSSLEGYVVLRNHDVFANLKGGGDVDLLVSDPPAAERAAVACFGPPLWTATRPHLKQYFYPWGNVDLFPGQLDWHGAPYLPLRAVLPAAERSKHGFPRPRPAHEALSSWMNSLLWGGFFKERYRGLIVQAARDDGDAFRQALAWAFGEAWGARLHECARAGVPERSAAWVAGLRRALWWRAFRRNALRTMKGWLGRSVAELRLRLRPPFPWLAVMGPDGSGKSSVLEALEARLGAFEVARGRWRPAVLRPWDETEDVPDPDPHGEVPRSTLASTAKVFFLLADWLLGYCTKIADLRSKGYFVFFDRHYLDLLVDPQRYRFAEPLWLARWAARFVPTPTVLVFLDAPAEVLQARKQEVPLEETVRQRNAYRALARRLPQAHIVDATQPLEAVVDEVEQLLLGHRRAQAFAAGSSVAGSSVAEGGRHD